MTSQSPVPRVSSEGFNAELESLATAVEERPPIPVETGPATRSNRHVYWLIGALCALTIGAAEVGILVNGAPPDVAAAPARVVSDYQADQCATRTAAIMEAISRYTAQHGGRPPSLAALYPGYLTFAPVDPVSNEPYDYATVGESVSLTCPSAAGPAGSTDAPRS
jgi:hypothetical protein